MVDTAASARPNQIRLTVPVPDTAENPLVETEPNQLRQWIEALPYADPGRVVSEALSALRLLNRYPRVLPQRIQLMQAYADLFDNLLSTAIRNSRMDNLAQHKHSARLLDAYQELVSEFGNGCKRAINEALDGHPMRPPELAFAAYYAIKTHSLAMIFSYAGFNPAPRNLWREILQIHRIAGERKLNQVAVDDPTQQAEAPATVDLLVRQNLLLQLVDPYRLQVGEIWNAYHYLSRWAGLSLFMTARDIEGQPGLFLVDMRGVETPTFLARHRGRPLKPHHQVFNTAPLIRQAHQHLHALDDGEPGSLPPGTEGMRRQEVINMLRDMLIAWHMQPQRRSDRSEKYGWIATASGISAAHYFQSLSGDGNWLLGADLDAGDNEVELSSSPFLPIGSNSYQTFRARMINTSDAGLGLQTSRPHPPELQVGQVVLMRESDDRDEFDEDSEWFVGVVRRMVNRDADTAEFGIQRLSGKLQPVRLKPIAGDWSQDADFQPALMLERGNGQAHVLLTPKGMYQDGRQYLLESRAQLSRVGADKLLEGNRHFDRFQFRFIEQVENQ